MATTTPNYGWAVPTSTDLVKDGATAIETLGDAIDASMNTALGTKKAGMVLLNTTSFSGVTSFSLTANSFSATYDDYKVLVDITGFATAGTMSARLRASGTDDSTANYSNGVYEVRTNNTSAILAANLGQTSFNLNSSSIDATQCSVSYSFDVISPKLATRTKVVGFSSGLTTSGTDFRYFYHAHIFNGTTAFDSISFIGPGNMTGRVSVYGYSK
jgi:hypothetical protein